jgi:hypothetical protein
MSQQPKLFENVEGLDSKYQLNKRSTLSML